VTTINYGHGGDKAKRRAIRAQVKAMAWERLKAYREEHALDDLLEASHEAIEHAARHMILVKPDEEPEQ
jgi:hypothetical protein